MRPIRILSSIFIAFALAVSPLLHRTVEAQGRTAVRRAAPPRAGGVVVGAYYRPFYVAPFYDPFYDPWWYPYPFGWSGWYAPYAYGPAYRDTASLRLQVTPREAEVYVDGYYAGTANDFDGMFQRLSLEPGEHDVTLYLAGHRTIAQKIFLQDRGTFRIRHTMTALAAGEPEDTRPASAPAGTTTSRAPRPPAREPVRGDASFGAIAIRVQPADAEVLIDGERWEGPAGGEALIVQVSPGQHRIEVRKDGFRAYSADIAVTAAQTAPVNISLPRQEQ